jgi:hypothetical protein
LQQSSFFNSAAKPESPAQISDPRKRTRGVQSSILTAMALKEKRATLSEAKDIRKVKHFINAFFKISKEQSLS